MLLISAGKFFQSSRLHETTFAAPIIPNSNYLSTDGIEIQPAAGVDFNIQCHLFQQLSRRRGKPCLTCNHGADALNL